jgi:PleD family two-component response regulator
MNSAHTAQTPLVLLVDDQEKSSRLIESILKPRGQVVLNAYTGRQALDLVSKVSPDVILVSWSPSDMDGVDLIRSLRSAQTVRPTTPVLAISDDALGRAQRLEAFSAGAWEVLTQPIDPNELILRIETFVRAKQEADRVRDEALTDPDTGFYNVRGILQRAREISADATRFNRPLTCVALGSRSQHATGSEGTSESPELAETLARPVADALREVTRICDTIGRLGPGEFVVVAPGTDREGAARLADRVLEAVEAELKRGGYGSPADAALLQVRAGFFAPGPSERITPEDLLLRATMALRSAQADQESFRVRAYEA